MASYDYPEPCPKCSAEPHLPCRSLTTGRTTDSHKARRDLVTCPERGIGDHDCAEHQDGA